MRIVVTCGPSSEPIDRVRRLTNASTGSLGLFLAAVFAKAGHQVVCFRGTGAAAQPPAPDFPIRPFTTTEDLARELRALAREQPVDALFHAAALSDFRVGSIEDAGGRSVAAGKLGSDSSYRLLLLPAPKLLPQLRPLFPRALLTGWKFEVDGDRAAALARGKQQLLAAGTDMCVVNGPAYGSGFGLLARDGSWAAAPDREALAELLLERLARRGKACRPPE
ncbi:Phosphopantothenoylcysteine synthetase/decarboxylase [Methylacidimicrobium sp. AP8]|uniref:phosphopantothenoylcysteine decarboxylase domain-containing protein n=1 Tax=Methylacidimicrobium sp. AP8 TaxID=2730359 RepID=UPI0018C187D5|nr:phosphopantothenoylcysteine decarboxylase [Methylacidimicrobium sp. AP8]CAB4243842.1 Phosphopantothenoylcysteine synthetase/decarboxylase [Methylacidimicrobium sp. AP8]